jgi:hypothetical protein
MTKFCLLVYQLFNATVNGRHDCGLWRVYLNGEPLVQVKFDEKKRILNLLDEHHAGTPV